MNLRLRFSLSIALSVFSLGITYLVLGYFYGWVDDVLITNYMQGIPIHQPIAYTFDVFFILSKGYRWCYQQFPQVPWMGIFMGIWIFIATVNFFFFLTILLSEVFDSIWPILAFALLIYFLVWVENVYLINFSRTAILLMGTSFVNIHYLFTACQRRKSTVLLLAFFWFTFLIGLLTRMQTIFILLPLFCVLSLWGHKKLYQRFVLIGAVALLMLAYVLIDNMFFNMDPKSRNTSVHILNIVDGLNTYESDVSVLAKDPRNLALFHYYFPDSFLINTGYLDSLGPSSAFNPIGLKHIVRNLQTEFWKATYYTAEYHQPLNWFWKFCAFTLVNLFLLLASAFSYSKHRLDWQKLAFQIFVFGSFYFTVFLITVLSKMEDRVLTPALIVFTLAHVYVFFTWHNQWVKNTLTKSVIISFFLLLFVLTVFRFNGYLTVANEKKTEMNLKRDVIAELNTDFKHKIIFYDLWTMTLLHQRPLQTISLDTSNIHTCYGEYWSNVLIKSHQNFLQDMCGATDFLSFYKCLYKNRKDVVFVFSEPYRKDLIEKYAAMVYGEKLKFREIHKHSKLKNIHYSFLWGRNDFGYYVFDNSFDDVTN